MKLPKKIYEEFQLLLEAKDLEKINDFIAKNSQYSIELLSMIYSKSAETEPSKNKTSSTQYFNDSNQQLIN